MQCGEVVGRNRARPWRTYDHPLCSSGLAGKRTSPRSTPARFPPSSGGTRFSRYCCCVRLWQSVVSVLAVPRVFYVCATIDIDAAVVGTMTEGASPIGRGREEALSDPNPFRRGHARPASCYSLCTAFHQALHFRRRYL